jgi:hypothetical protein
MTARMNSNFINYSDFLNLLVEAFKTAPRELFEKMIELITSAFQGFLILFFNFIKNFLMTTDLLSSYIVDCKYITINNISQDVFYYFFKIVSFAIFLNIFT